MSIDLKEIFLNSYHKDNFAKFIPFAGYSMPINYTDGIIKENLQVRNSAGIFDVSHMGQILILISSDLFDRKSPINHTCIHFIAAPTVLIEK